LNQLYRLFRLFLMCLLFDLNLIGLLYLQNQLYR
jgi:hypothetical protein